jgi:hypothetical protein
MYPESFVDALDDLLQYYIDNPSPVINFEQITQFFMAVYGDECFVEAGCRLSTLLERDSAHSLLLSLIAGNFHQLVYYHVSLSDVSFVLLWLILPSSSVSRWFSSPEVD